MSEHIGGKGFSPPGPGEPGELGRGPRAWLLGGFLLLFAAIGALGTVAVAVDWLQGVATYSWREARCTIRGSRVSARPEVGDHLFEVAYTYRWDGEERPGATYRTDYSGSDDEAAARVLASRFQPGDEVPCWVDPDDPDRSALLRADLWRGLWIFVPLLFLAVGGGMLRVLFGRRRGPAAETAGEAAAPAVPAAPGAAASTLAEGARGFKAWAVPLVLFGVFFLFGTGILLPFFAWPALNALEARSWDAVECEILESGVASHTGDDGATYSVEVLYRYTVDGRDYLSDRYQFLSGSSSGYDGKAEVVRAIPAGTRATCYVDPDDPHRAVLDRRLSAGYLFGLVPLLFALVGAGGLWLTWAAARSARAAAARPAWIEVPPPDPERPRVGSVTLEPAATPLARLAGITAVALVWNGITGVFAWRAVESLRAGHPDWFVIVVISPFVLIGLLLATGIPYAFLALANPRPRLRLSRGALLPGESAQVEWSFRGLTGRLRKLTIRLAGGPPLGGAEARARAGDPAVKTVIDVVERPRGQGLEFGAASFTLPADARPTSRDAADPYAWKLQLEGEIAYWPDVVEEYEIEVLEPR